MGIPGRLRENTQRGGSRPGRHISAIKGESRRDGVKRAFEEDTAVTDFQREHRLESSGPEPKQLGNGNPTAIRNYQHQNKQRDSNREGWKENKEG